ncbi:MAG: alanine dehydrogenase, partial [Prevotellaceae bacterium]|nr:alanine dehydrogenase [Prevotellaceae bacterium]
MTIAIPKEIKNNENRVALTPAGAQALSQRGHEVLVQASAGVGSGFADADYAKAGATIVSTAEATFAAGDMVMKVKEPIAPEYKLIRPQQLLFTYFHFAADRELTDAMLASRAVCLAYETVAKPDGSLPLLVPMSEVAGRMAVQQGAKYLEKPQGGKGILLGGVPGVKPANVLVLGGGVVGTHAAFMAAGLGAHVTIMDISLPRLRYLSEVMPANVTTIASSRYAIEQYLPTADLV